MNFKFIRRNDEIILMRDKYFEHDGIYPKNEKLYYKGKLFSGFSTGDFDNDNKILGDNCLDVIKIDKDNYKKSIETYVELGFKYYSNGELLNGEGIIAYSSYSTWSIPININCEKGVPINDELNENGIRLVENDFTGELIVRKDENCTINYYKSGNKIAYKKIAIDGEHIKSPRYMTISDKPFCGEIYNGDNHLMIIDGNPYTGETNGLLYYNGYNVLFGNDSLFYQNHLSFPTKTKITDENFLDKYLKIEEDETPKKSPWSTILEKVAF